MDSISKIIKNQSDDIPTPENNNEQVKNTNKKTVDDIKMKEVEEKTEASTEEILNKNQNETETENNQQLSSLVSEINQKLDIIINLLQKNNESGVNTTETSKVVEELEGVFDGKEMIASNAERFEVPINFINDKKLVEGDLLKLEVREDKTYEYKQIGSVNRKRVVGTLVFNQDEQQWIAKTETETYKIINETIDLHKGEEKNKVVVMVPKNGKSSWATIENVFK